MFSGDHNGREKRTASVCWKLAMCSLPTWRLVNAEWGKMDASQRNHESCCSSSCAGTFLFFSQTKEIWILRVFIWSPETTEKLSTGVSEENQLEPTSVITDTLANDRHSGGRRWGPSWDVLSNPAVLLFLKRFLYVEIFTVLHKQPDQLLDLLIISRLAKQRWKGFLRKGTKRCDRCIWWGCSFLQNIKDWIKMPGLRKLEAPLHYRPLVCSDLD